MWSALLSLTAVPALAQAFGIPDDNRMVQEPGLLRFPLAVSEGAPIVKNITKRQSDISLESQQTGWFYTIDLVMGTPGQTVKVNFDTGSAELWVNAQCSTSSDPEFCATFPRFTGSSTLVDLQSQSTITYGSGSVDIEYSYDFVSIGGARINQQIFGVGTASEILTVGIMGAGPDLYGWEAPYPLPIDNLFTQGFINHRAFSLDMRSIESSRGSVIYGGLDTKKYSGHLEARPIIPASSSPDQLTRYWIYVDGIALTQPDGTKDTLSTQPLGVLLDSGYTVSALPSSIFNVLLEKFPTVQPIPGSTLYEVDCSVGELDGTVDFTFGETVIKVPYNDFIWKQPQFDICVLGAFLDDEFPVLGDSFLRAAYVVYDWDNRVIHLANNEDCGSNLVAFGTGVDAIPDIVGECGGTQETTTSEMPTSTSTTEAESTTETTAESTTESSTEATTTAESTTALETDSTTAAETETTTAADTTTTGAADSTTTLSFSTTHYYNTSSIATSTKYTDSHTTNVYPTNSHTADGYATGSHTTSLETLTSTITATNIYTITSCAPTVTNCPVGSVTTEVVTSYTTYCPGEETKPKPTKAPVTSLTSTYTSTRTYTVTDCHGKGSCTKGALTTEVYTSTTMVCPQTTATYTLHQTIRCPYGQDDCMAGSTKTIDHVFTIYPVTEYPVPTPVPGCSSCVPPANNATATYKPTYHASDKVPSYTAPVSEPTETISVVTGAAAWNAPGLVAVAMGVLLAAAI